MTIPASPEFSLWISTVPWSASLSDDDFLYLGSANDHSGSESYSTATTGILGQTTASAIVIDGSSGPVMTYSTNSTRVNPVTGVRDDTSYLNCSNAKARTILRQMRQAIQMQQCAYVLRVYNIASRIKGSASVQRLTQYTSGRNYLDLYVFINSVTVKYEPDMPEALTISLSLTMRNRGIGYDV